MGQDAAAPHAGDTQTLSEAAEAQRPRLRALAYRMLGSLAEAEDIVQDAAARCLRVREPIDQPRAYLTRMVTRLCLDQLKSARMRREAYVGPWLPEPVLDDASLRADCATELADDVSFALLLVLDRLSALERAAFLLHDVFDMEFSEVAHTLGRSEAACRQLARRAREHVREGRPTPPSLDQNAQRSLTEAFFAAARQGDTGALTGLLSRDAILMSDGGGKRSAALNPITGAGRIARFLQGIQRRWPAREWLSIQRINGAPGIVFRDAEGYLSVMSLQIAGERVQRVYVTRNPDKLGALTQQHGPLGPQD